jgi:hypothetical protein
MHKQPDYSTWFTKDQTAAALHVSTKQVERFSQAGQLQPMRWTRPTGGQPINVYAPDDVDRLAHKLLPSRPYVAPPEPPASNGHGLRRQAAPATMDVLTQSLLAVAQRLGEPPVEQKVYLTLDEAARVSGLSKAYLRRACQERSVMAIKDGGWKIRRTALAAL